MDRRMFVKNVPAISLIAGTGSGLASDLQQIVLPKPEKEGSISVLSALQKRSTNPPSARKNFHGRCFRIYSGRRSV